MKVTRFQPQGMDTILSSVLSGISSVASNSYAIGGVVVEGAAGSNYHIVAYSSNYARWIPHDASGGGGSVSFGSNSTDVSGSTAGGSSSDSARADHRHAGIATVTASSSNTLERPTVNLRAGNNVSFGLTDSNGNGALDTVTIHAAASGGGGSSSLTVQDEGSPLATSATTLNFVGAGVTASGTGATKTITIAGGGSTRPYPLDRYAIDGTYGDDFTGGSLSGSWTRRNYVGGDETYQVGYEQTYLRIDKTSMSTGDGYFRTAPGGDWTFAMKYILRHFAGQDTFSWGVAVVDSSGTGVGTVLYNNPRGPLLVSISSYTSYGGSFVRAGGLGSGDIWNTASESQATNDRPIWVSLRKSGTDYYIAYSLDGETWTFESSALSWGGTVDRVAMMDVPLGTTNVSPGSYVDVDWFNKIA